MAENWQTEFKDEEFPILCETCLGENPFIRMTREAYGKACKICDRPFTVFRWRPGPRARYKKTELCHTCAKIKNVCQTCVLDLQYGLPVQVRDSTLEDWEKQATPVSDTNRDFLLEQHERKVEGVDKTYGKVQKPSSLLNRLARRAPYYRRNLPHICSFYAKGECNRGTLCPFRHEMPISGPLANQNIKDRYYGQNDPVAEKMLNRIREQELAMDMPEDKCITTLWVGGIDPSISESQIRSKFYPYGELKSVRMIPKRKCCFVTFKNRKDCEEAAKNILSKLNINGHQMRLSWGKKNTKSPTGPPGVKSRHAPSIGAPRPPGPAPPGVKVKPMYPSQDPRNLSARVPTSQRN